jgi:hypothetical protein
MDRYLAGCRGGVGKGGEGRRGGWETNRLQGPDDVDHQILASFPWPFS